MWVPLNHRKRCRIHLKYEVKVQAAKKMTNFGGFFAFFQPKWGSYAILAQICNQKNYGQHLGQMSKKGQSTLGKAKGAKTMNENRFLMSLTNHVLKN